MIKIKDNSNIKDRKDEHIYKENLKTAIGNLVVITNNKYLLSIRLLARIESFEHKQYPKIMKNTLNQLKEYFRGDRKKFILDYQVSGTTFQVRVWKELLKVNSGGVVSYGEIAKRINSPNAARAVGMALNKNPLLIIIPCHRVIAAKMALGGFACGLEAKRKLLQIEGINM